MTRRSSFAVLWLSIIWVTGGASAFGNPERVAPGHSGAAGEADCTACHFDRTAKRAGDSLEITGFPQIVLPGETYVLTISLTHEIMKRAGFQLSIRTSDGKQAGALDPTAAVAKGDTGIAFMDHRMHGAPLVGDGTASWVLSWTTPGDEADACVIYLNLAANAANDDASPFGDQIYLLERVLHLGGDACKEPD